MILKDLTLENIEQVRKWRNENIESLRTSFLLTKEMQEDFYINVICNRNAKARFWGVWVDDSFIGMVGLENLEWENGLGEISIVLNPDYKDCGYGKQAVELLLDKGFNSLRLENIYGECYKCNPAYGFWEHIIKKYRALEVHLPYRKYINGKFYNSLYFNISKGDYNGTDNT
jgi:RimJ/RimL family protein N-acetyltransferase